MNILKCLVFAHDVLPCYGTFVRGLSSGALLYGKGTRHQSQRKKKKGISTPPKYAALNTSDTAEWADLPIIIIKATYNNTLLYLTDHLGTTAKWNSAGIEGFKNCKRGTNYAGQVAGEGLAKAAVELGVNRVRIKLKGMGPGRNDAVKGLTLGGIEIVSVTDITPVPFNGPKAKKARRI